MIFSVLASGSKGNVTYITSGTTQILVDIGITTRNLEQKLTEIEVKPNQINGILLTHTHSDHIQGLKSFIKKYPVKIYLSSKMYNEISKTIQLFNYEIIENECEIDNILVKVIKLSHDTDDSNGYILEANNNSLVYITDTGYIHKRNYELLKNKNAYIIESNHDINLLMNGRYPYHIKQRILGDRGHLSNIDCANYLTKFVGDKTKCIILIHLSDENNNPDIAIETVETQLKKGDITIDKLIVSEQTKRTEMISL